MARASSFFSFIIRFYIDAFSCWDSLYVIVAFIMLFVTPVGRIKPFVSSLEVYEKLFGVRIYESTEVYPPLLLSGLGLYPVIFGVKAVV